MKLIPLNKGKFAMIDDLDYNMISAFNWSIIDRGERMYAYTKINGKNIRMHRFIMNVTDPKILIDHKNRNGLDNTRGNLRTATHAQNCANKKATSGTSSVYLGVGKRQNKWNARITKDGITHELGYYAQEVEAALAYDNKARELHGEFANLNFKDQPKKVG